MGWKCIRVYVTASPFHSSGTFKLFFILVPCWDTMQNYFSVINGTLSSGEIMQIALGRTTNMSLKVTLGHALTFDTLTYQMRLPNP